MFKQELLELLRIINHTILVNILVAYRDNIEQQLKFTERVVRGVIKTC